MCNEEPTLEEVSDIVYDINDQLGDLHAVEGYGVVLDSDGYNICVRFGGTQVWNSDWDYRKYTREGSREDLHNHIVSELKSIGSCLVELKEKSVE